MSEPSVPFAQFMADALYSPENGYYVKNIKTVGSRGDFSTSATLHSALGSAIHGWLKEQSVANPEISDIIEVGPGDGSLMETVRSSAGWFERRRFNYHLVESSPVLSEIQQRRLGHKVTHHTDIKSALSAAGGKAFIYSNELVDAFPATLLQWSATSESWDEIWLTKSAGTFQEVAKPFSPENDSLEVSSALSSWNKQSPPPANQRIEIHFSYLDWLRSWAPMLKSGSMLTIDYGDVFPNLYHRRPHGTLRAYYNHTVREREEIYQMPGRQDITADVNFTDLINWSHQFGWETDSLMTQRKFIEKYGNKRQKGPESAREHIMSQHGAGGAFTLPSAPAYACGLTSGGEAWCWGGTIRGDLWEGPTDGPIRVEAGIRIRNLGLGAEHLCGVTTEGWAFCGGGNYAGQLGDGTSQDRAPMVGVVRP